MLSVRDPETGKRKVQFRSLPNCKNKREAQNACAALIADIAAGSFIQTSKTTLREWIEHWVSVGCPGNKLRKEVGARTIERYAQLLRVHVIPALGARPLQQVQSSEIDALYVRLGEKISARTAHHVHTVLNACFGTAARTRKIGRNPMMELLKVPSPDEADHGLALETEQLRMLVQGSESHRYF